MSAALMVAALFACHKLPIPDKGSEETPVIEPDEPGEQEDWTPGVKVKIKLHSNTALDNFKSIYATTGTVLGEETEWTPASSGKLFKGWFLDPEASKEFDFTRDTIKREMDLYAGYITPLKLVDRGKVARVTGNSLVNEKLPNPNQTAKNWNVGGTDLGIIWQMSDGQTYGTLFGDTFGSDFVPGSGGPNGTDWRSNVLGYSKETDLSKGLVFYSMLHSFTNTQRATSVIVRDNYFNFTYIPTAAISLNGKEYMHYMYWEVNNTRYESQNYSSFCVSSDNGQTWKNCKSQIKFNSGSYFNMVALAKKEGDPYCYMMGCLNGSGYRISQAKLARFKYEDILDKSKYEYYNSTYRKWMVDREVMATTVLDGTVGELSLMYMENHGCWLALYFDKDRYAICYRSAGRINGPWSSEEVLVSGNTAGCSQLYGSYIHPYCARKDNDSGEIYWTMSQWAPYNVFLMKAEIVE